MYFKFKIKIEIMDYHMIFLKSGSTIIQTIT